MTATLSTWTALALTVAVLAYMFGIRSYLAWRAADDTGLRTPRVSRTREI